MIKLFLYCLVVVVIVFCLTDIVSSLANDKVYKTVSGKRIIILEIILLLIGSFLLYEKAAYLLTWLYEK